LGRGYAVYLTSEHRRGRPKDDFGQAVRETGQGRGRVATTQISDRRRAKRAGASPRRDKDRNKTLKSAKIVFNKNQSVIDCFVRDLSDTGAKLVFGALTAVPRTFLLELHDGTRRECERVRTVGKEIGVRFLK
jgi:hypothetical protein